MDNPNESVRLEYYTSLVKKDLETGIIMLTGEIEPATATVLVRDIREILRLRGDGPLTVELFSGGGHVASALHMYDTLREYAKRSGPVTVYASGMAASAAAGLVLQAADNRVATPYCSLMLHEVSVQSTPQSMSISMGSLEDLNKEMRRLQDIMTTIVAARTGKTKEYWDKKIEHHDVWFSAEQALEEGLIDRIAA